MHTMSVSWQNRRHGQSLVAHGRVKKQHQNNMFLNYDTLINNHVLIKLN